MKITKIILFVLMFLFTYNVNAAGCSIPLEGGGGDLGTIITGCIEGGDSLVAKPGDLDIDRKGINDIINKLIKNAGPMLGILAVLGITYGGFLMTISGGSDDKIKKGKDIIKWTIIGFIGLVTAGGIIRLIIYVIYGLT